METSRETILRGRLSRLEATLTHYDARLNTRQADADRQRIAALEAALIDVLCSHEHDDPAAILAKSGVSIARGAQILNLLPQKFA